MHRGTSLLFLLFLATLAGCAPHTQYRTQLEPCASQNVQECAGYYVESQPEYDLGFVEFDDQGWFWDRRQMWGLIDRLSEEVHKQDLLIIVYAHGWKHNASVCDENVSCFRETLKRISHMEKVASEQQKRDARKVVGVYLGWRGLSVENDLLSNLTFWDRKNTAQQVGHGAVTELLVRLNSIRYIHRNITGEPTPSGTQLIIVGHSFGGAVIYSALSQLLIDRFVDYRGEGKPPEPFGDLVVLVNPAFEAKQYEALHIMAAERSYFPGQMPVMAIVTSKGDQATKLAFPLGRWFSTMFEKTRDADEKAANRTTVGHFERYRTHDLIVTQKPVATKNKAKDLACACSYLGEEATVSRADYEKLATFRQRWLNGELQPGWEQEFPGALLKQRPGEKPLNPFFVISADNAIVNGHSDIYRPVFIDFLRQFILLSAP